MRNRAHFLLPEHSYSCGVVETFPFAVCLTYVQYIDCVTLRRIVHQDPRRSAFHFSLCYYCCCCCCFCCRRRYCCCFSCRLCCCFCFCCGYGCGCGCWIPFLALCNHNFFFIKNRPFILCTFQPYRLLCVFIMLPFAPLVPHIKCILNEHLITHGVRCA